MVRVKPVAGLGFMVDKGAWAMPTFCVHKPIGGHVIRAEADRKVSGVTAGGAFLSGLTPGPTEEWRIANSRMDTAWVPK